MLKQRLLAAALTGLLLLAAGCSGSQSPDSTDSAPEPSPSSGPAVYTDWSALTPYEGFQTVEHRWYPEYTDTLIPRADYGTLVPYSGDMLTYSYFWDDSSSYPYYHQGLATLDGTLVTDPVFTNLYRPGSFDYATGRYTWLPMWVLCRTDNSGQDAQQLCAFAALDGSWCTDFCYQNPSEGVGLTGGSDGVFLYNTTTERCVLLGIDGQEKLSWGQDDQTEDEWWMYSLLSSLSSGEGFACRQYWDQSTYSPIRTVFYDLSTGALLDTPELSQATPFSQGLAAAQDAVTGLWGYLSTDGSWAIPPSYTEAESFYLDTAIVYRDGHYQLIDREGTILYSFDTASQVYRDGEYIRVTPADGDPFWLDRQFNQVPDRINGMVLCETYSNSGPILYYTTESETVIFRDGEEYHLPLAGMVNNLVGDLVILQQESSNSSSPYSTYFLVDLSGEVLYRSESGFLTLLTDELDQSVDSAYFLLSGDDINTVLTSRGEVLFTSTSWPQLYGGLFRASDAFSTGLRDSSGNWVLRLSAFGTAND